MPLNKEYLLSVAEVVDAFRVFPRLLLLSDFIFTCWYCWFAIKSVILLVTLNSIENAGIINGVAAVIISGTIPFITHRFGKIADIYIQTGRKWG